MTDRCVFCDYAGPSEIVADDPAGFVIAPLNPVAPGHMLAVSRGHVDHALADPDTFGRLATLAADYARAEGLAACNLVASVGGAATQTIGHLHLHIVPRRRGDGLALPWTDP
jgi:histidine triad (HIT) family protein